ncbi:MAG: hypothetical protein F6K41_12480 [Symploca sp. SIO3E6]|nr:hypothetical protein [Caldora sp. SIO3E6]
MGKQKNRRGDAGTRRRGDAERGIFMNGGEKNFFIRTASCLLPSAFCLLPPASCLLPPASCLGAFCRDILK